MRSKSRSKSTRLFGQGLTLPPRPGVLNHRLGLATAAHSGWPAHKRVCRPALDDRELFDCAIVVEDATLSVSLKRTSWTSQLL
jgi:hypothetical protein